MLVMYYVIKHFPQTAFTHPNTIRGEMGLSDTRNAVHGSDSHQSAYAEISVVFPDFNVEEWCATLQDKTSQHFVFDNKTGVHVLKEVVAPANSSFKSLLDKGEWVELFF